MRAVVTKTNIQPVGVMNKGDLVEIYLGGNTELFKLLVDRHGLRPVYARKTRLYYRLAAVDQALLECEMVAASGPGENQEEEAA